MAYGRLGEGSVSAAAAAETIANAIEIATAETGLGRGLLCDRSFMDREPIGFHRVSQLGIV